MDSVDAQDLLEDLHFELSNAGSNQTVESRQETCLFGKNIQLAIEDRTKMTEKWVANVRLLNRRRCSSYDSYFEKDSVCTKLKRSFLKPKVIKEEDLEDLRLRFVRLGLQDSDVLSPDQKDSVASIAVTKAKEPAWFYSQTSAPELRYRSRTVPMSFKISEQANACIKEVPMDMEAHHDTSLNLASLQSVDLIRDILFDENCNLVHKAVTIDSLKCPEPEERLEGSFRSICVYPTQSELKNSKGLSKKIGMNKIKESYENEEEYLETQFQLLREDFIIPLREGIRDYKKQLWEGIIPAEVRNLKLHHDLRILGPRFFDNKLSIAIDMGYPLSEKIGDKDFMDGSLVLLTPNHFKDIYVATVVSRKFLPINVPRENLKRKTNTLMVQLHGTSHFDATITKRKVLLAESQAFFQPYHYIMKIFQGMSWDDLPMKEYILGSSASGEVMAPSYLMKNTEYTLESKFKVDVMNVSSWPKAEDLHVNDSQLNALYKALSQRLVLIQGPPGTGKTYLGCKVAQALLQNRQVWNQDGNQPMLLMCQTNHALDQFMELLLPVSKRIIRIGSQSKSSRLAPFTMRAWLQKSCGKRSGDSPVVKQSNEVKNLASIIQKCHVELKRLKAYGILDFSTLVSVGVVELEHANCVTSSEHYLMWLDDARHCQINHKATVTQVCSKNSSSQMNCDSHINKSDCALSNSSSSSSDKLLNIVTEKDNDKLREAIHINYIVTLQDLDPQQPDVKDCEREQRKRPKADMERRLKFYREQLTASKTRDHCDSTNCCLWDIKPCDRWALYRLWVNKLEAILQAHLEKLESQYMSTYLVLDDLMQGVKLETMRQAELVGMTTSAAARLYPILRELRCPIAIVEEAAEVQESHIVATVTKHCQHLILLGDHKQLRPRPACYSLSRTHFTDVSLFERLTLNNTVCVNTLLIQHRMRPEFSELITPSIYKKLYDHECTKNRENIQGMKENVFFFSHNWQEAKNDLTGSFCNPLEARMAVQLLRYLLRQSYNPHDICILAAYREQVNEIDKEIAMYPELSGVRNGTVDNFQGEESTIIILSLVRNNNENQTGFLKIENRVCVALSRARDGLFILGNINLLSGNSELWQSVHKVLKDRCSVGQSFHLSCLRHPGQTIEVSHPDDFSLYIHKGCCQRNCAFKLPCGHRCRRKCHADDALHLRYRCDDFCKRKCRYGHLCQKKCFEKCQTCDSMVWKSLDCGHKALMKCSVSLDHYMCEVTVKKCMQPCSHWVTLQCWMPSKSQKYCSLQCPVKLRCGHQCPLRCNAPQHPNHNEMKCKCEDQLFGNLPHGFLQQASNCDQLNFY